MRDFVLINLLTLLAEQTTQSPLQSMDPQTRAGVFTALFSVVALGCVLLVLVLLTGRAVRRFSRDAERPKWTNVDPDDWASKPLIGDERASDSEAGDA